MAESQSRYSIVERLLQKKLEIMSDKLKLKEESRTRQQYVDKLKKELENWKKDIQEDIKREQRKKEIDIERAIQYYDDIKEQMQEKEQVFDEQINAIGDSLKSIEEISKISPTIQS